MTSGHDHGSQQEILRELRSDELSLFLPLGLTLVALFMLGYAVWFYLQGIHLFAGVMTGLGAFSIVLLVLGNHIGRTQQFLTQLLFGLQMVLIGQLIVLYCPVGRRGWLALLPLFPRWLWCVATAWVASCCWLVYALFWHCLIIGCRGMSVSTRRI